MNKYTQPGTTVGGKVVRKPEVRDLTDWKTGEVKRFGNGEPMKQYVITVQTDLRDPEVEDDDGLRRIFVKGWNKKTLKKAVADSGAPTVVVGGELYDTFVSQDPETNVKTHSYRYVPPPAGSQPPAEVDPEVRARQLEAFDRIKRAQASSPISHSLLSRSARPAKPAASVGRSFDDEIPF